MQRKTAGVLSEIGDIIATLSMSADPDKQQIPPLRCAPVGMTNYVNHFRDRTLVLGCADVVAACGRPGLTGKIGLHFRDAGAGASGGTCVGQMDVEVVQILFF